VPPVSLGGCAAAFVETCRSSCSDTAPSTAVAELPAPERGRPLDTSGDARGGGLCSGRAVEQAPALAPLARLEHAVRQTAVRFAGADLLVLACLVRQVQEVGERDV
jgi:hypothetical protein